ncbi:aldose 1-epimerase family protein [Cutibacterium avidum]|uniref:aldose 1-epimerase family protein n=1 Tax=Cutibacterium avidum TaxID=33010 RepID=UPI002FF1B5DB
MYIIPLHESLFTAGHDNVLLSSDEFTVTAKRYESGVASVTVSNSRGHVEVLPFMGQIIWDVVFDGVSLTMDNMFSQPQPADVIVNTYGCFAFHSGLLANGCPAPEDTHPLHGEFPCSRFDEGWLEVSGDTIAVSGRREYAQGFGHHYQAVPRVSLAAGATMIDIDLSVTNLSHYQPMPLQYMCHMNYAWIDGARMSQSIGDVFQLRRSVPAHVSPTQDWLAFNEEILAGGVDSQVLADGSRYDPEIVYFADDLPQYGSMARFEMSLPEGGRFVTEFSTEEFTTATRWLLHNADQRVCAFVLPGTCRPEGRNAAEASGTLINLEAGETRHFHVHTGMDK